MSQALEVYQNHQFHKTWQSFKDEFAHSTTKCNILPIAKTSFGVFSPMFCVGDYLICFQ